MRFLLPEDHIAATKIDPNITIRIIRPGEEIPGEMMGLDIGPETVEQYRDEIRARPLIFWNGPMGVFEVDAFAGGTMEIAAAVARRQGHDHHRRRRFDRRRATRPGSPTASAISRPAAGRPWNSWPVTSCRASKR